MVHVESITRMSITFPLLCHNPRPEVGEGHWDLSLPLPGNEEPGGVLAQLLPLHLPVPAPLRLINIFFKLVQLVWRIDVL